MFHKPVGQCNLQLQILPSASDFLSLCLFFFPLRHPLAFLSGTLPSSSFRIMFNSCPYSCVSFFLVCSGSSASAPKQHPAQPEHFLHLAVGVLLQSPWTLKCSWHFHIFAASSASHATEFACSSTPPHPMRCCFHLFVHKGSLLCWLGYCNAAYTSSGSDLRHHSSVHHSSIFRQLVCLLIALIFHEERHVWLSPS